MNEAPPRTPPAPAKKGCLGRNWKWMLPVGCLGFFLLCGGGIGGFFMLTMGAIKSTDAYAIAIKMAKSDPEVIAELGEPISDGFMVNGSVNTTNGDATTTFQVSLSGPKGSGTLHASAHKSAGSNWKYDTLQLETKNATLEIPH